VLAKVEVLAEQRIEPDDLLHGSANEERLVAVGGGSQTTHRLAGEDQDPGDLHRHVGCLGVSPRSFDVGALIPRLHAVSCQRPPSRVERREVGALPVLDDCRERLHGIRTDQQRLPKCFGRLGGSSSFNFHHDTQLGFQRLSPAPGRGVARR